MRSIHKKTCFAVIIGLALCLNVSAGLNDGLRAYYKLDGNAIDETGNHDGVVTGTSWVPGVDGSAASFNGTSDYITMGTTRDLLNTPQASFSMWVSFDDPTDSDSLLASYDGNYFEPGDLMIRQRLANEINVQYGTGFNTGINQNFGSPIDTNGWHHLAVIIDNTQPDTALRQTVYLDGKQINASSTYGTQNAKLNANIGDTSAPFRMAYWYDNDVHRLHHYWPGQLDEVRIYDRVLTESEIRQLAGFEPTALSEGHHVFDMKISARLLEEKRKSTIVGKEKIRGLLVYNGDTDSGRFIFKDRDELIVLETDFTYAEYINSTKETKKVSITQGVAGALITIDELLEAVALGSFRYLENPKGSLLNISLAGAGSAPEDEAYGTLLLRYNQKLSDRMNRAGNPEATLQRNVSKVTGVPLAEVEKAMSPEK